MSEERSVAERLAGLENQSKHVAATMGEMRDALSELTKTFSEFMARQAGVDQRLLAIEHDLRDGRQRFKAHDEAIAGIQRKCDQNEGLRIDGKKHLEDATTQDREVHGAVLTSAWAERAVWILIAGVLALVAYLRG